MSIALYMDVHVPAPITRALVIRGVDVVTSQADGTEELEDEPRTSYRGIPIFSLR